MGRKSKKAAEEPVAAKPTCFYCLRSFENEEVLISHQKLLHFRCPECNKKFSHAPGMAYHLKIVHGSELKAVPKAEPGRDDPTLNIVGSTGVPSEEEREERARKRTKLDVNSIDAVIDSIAAAVAASTSSSAGAAAEIIPLVPQVVTIKGLVYSDETISPEEKRAMLPRYRIDEDSLKEKLAAKDASIEARLREALAARSRAKPLSE